MLSLASKSNSPRSKRNRLFLQNKGNFTSLEIEKTPEKMYEDSLSAIPAG